MKTSEILMSLLLLSAMAFGLGSFFVSTAEVYSISTTDLDDFGETFNKYEQVDAKLQAIQSAISNIRIENPLTWGNAVTLIVNIFSIMFDIPGLIHVMISDTVTMSGILPDFTVWVVEGVILLMILFGAISGINKWRS